MLVVFFLIGMETQPDDPSFLSDILGQGGAVAGLDDLDFGLTQDTQCHDHEVQVSRSAKKGTARGKRISIGRKMKLYARPG